MQPPEFEIVPFRRDIPRDVFTCGNQILDNWLRKYAGQNENLFRTRTFYAVDAEAKKILGFYSTVYGSVEPSTELDGIPVSKYSRPAFLIAKLAVDLSEQGNGIGKALLSDALNKAIAASESAGLEVVLVDAINNEAVTYYGRFGFVRHESGSSRMFMTMNTLRNSK